ncbi:MAG TPA: alpha/beta hydrolase [Burkholderiales bacterium]|nr:alpha/beta hydrolase [Burkholderiales bacterium]
MKSYPEFTHRASSAVHLSVRSRLAPGFACFAVAIALSAPLAIAQAPAPGPREMPAKTVPVPDTVSPQVQKLIAAPLTPTWNVIPNSSEEWKAQINSVYVATMKGLPALRETLHVKVEPMTVDGVKAYRVTPEVIPPENRNRLLVHVHGGCFVSFPGESGTVEAVYMAGFGRFKVISVDYRMPPDHPYPAALDDAMTVWKAATKMALPKNMAIFGSSAGGNLTLAMVLRAKQDKLPLPAAIAPGTPMSDLTGAGDSFQTNAMLDNVLVTYGANCDKRAALYTGGRDLKDPMLSPVYGDMRGFPPAILTTGTRDLLLSNTVRVHRKLRQAGVEAVLQVFEGQSHAQYYRDVSAPETKEAFEEIARFFDKHLGK